MQGYTLRSLPKIDQREHSGASPAGVALGSSSRCSLTWGNLRCSSSSPISNSAAALQGVGFPTPLLQKVGAVSKGMMCWGLQGVVAVVAAAVSAQTDPTCPFPFSIYARATCAPALPIYAVANVLTVCPQLAPPPPNRLSGGVSERCNPRVPSRLR